jgi:hypothetical protein
MMEESHKSVAQLRQEVLVYQARLDEVERLAELDPLTGFITAEELSSRLSLESREGVRFRC